MLQVLATRVHRFALTHTLPPQLLSMTCTASHVFLCATSSNFGARHWQRLRQPLCKAPPARLDVRSARECVREAEIPPPLVHHGVLLCKHCPRAHSLGVWNAGLVATRCKDKCSFLASRSSGPGDGNDARETADEGRGSAAFSQPTSTNLFFPTAALLRHDDEVKLYNDSD